MNNEEEMKRYNVIVFEGMSFAGVIKECMQTTLISSAFSVSPHDLFVFSVIELIAFAIGIGDRSAC